MLNRHIQVVTDFRLLLHDLNQLFCNFFRITVKQANPDKPFDRAKLAQKLRQHLFPVKVDAVNGRLLCD